MSERVAGDGWRARSGVVVVVVMCVEEREWCGKLSKGSLHQDTGRNQMPWIAETMRGKKKKLSLRCCEWPVEAVTMVAEAWRDMVPLVLAWMWENVV